MSLPRNHVPLNAAVLLARESARDLKQIRVMLHEMEARQLEILAKLNEAQAREAEILTILATLTKPDKRPGAHPSTLWIDEDYVMTVLPACK